MFWCNDPFLYWPFSGISSLQKNVLTSASKLLIVEVTNLFSGLLKITVSCNGPYTLQVTGSSPLDFTYQLLDVEDLERGTTRRVIGNPLRGKAIKAINSLPAQLFDYFCFLGKAGGTLLECVQAPPFPRKNRERRRLWISDDNRVPVSPECWGYPLIGCYVNAMTQIISAVVAGEWTSE